MHIFNGIIWDISLNFILKQVIVKFLGYTVYFQLFYMDHIISLLLKIYLLQRDYTITGVLSVQIEGNVTII